MVRKEIKDKLEGGSKCFYYFMYILGDKGKISFRSVVSKIVSEMVYEVVELILLEMRGNGEDCRDGRKIFLYSEMCNKNKCGEK